MLTPPQVYSHTNADRLEQSDQIPGVREVVEAAHRIHQLSHRAHWFLRPPARSSGAVPDGARQIRMAKAMKCGQVYLNCYGAGGGVELPFGGVRRSGHGREKGLLALQEFCTVKTIVQYCGQ